MAVRRPNLLTLIHTPYSGTQRSAFQAKKNGPSNGPFPQFEIMGTIRG